MMTFELRPSEVPSMLSPSPVRPAPSFDFSTAGIGAAGGGGEGGVAGGEGGVEGGVTQKVGTGASALSTVMPTASLNAVMFAARAWNILAIWQAVDWLAVSMEVLTWTLAAVTIRVMSPAATPIAAARPDLYDS